MKIGIFDSGLGGLVIAKAIFKKLPKYDYIYLGDTKRVPYGDRSQKEIFAFTKKAVDFLFKQDCQLIIVACNTSSASALRKLQRQYLPKKYPNRRILGVVVPTVEVVGADTIRPKKIGVLATSSTVNSKAYVKELKKINPKVQIIQQKAPLLVPIIESNSLHKADFVLKSYVKPLLSKKVSEILLGCSHYPILIKQIREIAGKNVKIISQEKIIPAKLKSYLSRHREIDSKLSKNEERVFEITAKNKHFDEVAKTLFGTKIDFKLIKY
jgi:glutamate racemase